jgi:hypothetical protein
MIYTEKGRGARHEGLLKRAAEAVMKEIAQCGNDDERGDGIPPHALTTYHPATLRDFLKG